MSRLANTVNHRPASTCRAKPRVRITRSGLPAGAAGSAAGELPAPASNTMARGAALVGL